MSDYDDTLDAFGTELRAAHSRRRRTRRRIALGGAAAGATLVVGLGAALAIPGAPRAVDPVAEARAALGEDGEIIHYRGRWDVDLGPDPSSGRAGFMFETWAATGEPSRWRGIPGPTIPCSTQMLQGGNITVGPTEDAYVSGELRSYSRWSNTVTITPVPRRDIDSIGGLLPPELGRDRDPVTTIRHALDARVLSDEGMVSFAGRRVRVLRGEVGKRRLVEDGSYSVDIKTGKRKRLNPGKMIEERPLQLRFLVDADDYSPVSLTSRRWVLWSRAGGKDHYKWMSQTTSFELFERLPATPENRRLLRLDFPADVRVIRMEPARRTLTGPPDLKRPTKQEEAGARAAFKRCRAERGGPSLLAPRSR